MSIKAGYIALIGQPNAGKSTLMNALVGEKVAIVTAKPQTTRQRVVGLLTVPEGQLCFVDTPGLIRADKGLNQFLQSEIDDVMKDADAVLAVLNLDEKSFEKLEKVLDVVVKSRKPWAAVITKSDLGLDHRIERLRDAVRSRGGQCFVVSAKERPEEVRASLVPALVSLLPESPGPLYDPEMYTTQNVRDLAREIIREKCFENLHQEVPFGLAIRLRQMKTDDGRVAKVHADIVVAKDNHRPMVIGRNGQMVKTIGQQSRLEIEKLVGKPVYLELQVVVRKQWMENKQHLKELGYVQPV